MLAQFVDTNFWPIVSILLILGPALPLVGIVLYGLIRRRAGWAVKFATGYYGVLIAFAVCAFGIGRPSDMSIIVFGLLLLLGFPIGVVTAFAAFGALVDRVNSPNLEICAGCGYDLTGNVTDICPECGQSIGRSAFLRDDLERL